MEKSQKVTILATFVLVGFVTSVISHYVLGFYLHLKFPFNTFLSDANMFFSDFTKIILLIKDFAPFQTPNIWINYFPLTYILLFPFTLIKDLLLCYLIFFTIFLSFFSYLNTKFFKCEDLSKFENFQNIFILTIMTYPFLAVIDRGNIDMMILIAMTAFVYLFKSKKYLPSALILGIINAMKPFSLLFLFLFLYEKKWKEFFLSIISSAILIISGFFLLKGGFFHQISVYLINLQQFQKSYLYDINSSVQNCSSLFMALKVLLCNSANLISTHTLLKLYSFISLFFTCIILFFAWKEQFFWKKITLFTFHMLLIPYIIYDYKLIFLFIPLWLFVNTEEKSKFDLVYTILFALLFIPKRFLMISTTKVVLLSVVLNPLIMIIFMGLIIFEQFRSKKTV